MQTTRASDAYNEYEARSIKQHIYEALVAAGVAHDSRALRAVGAHEKAAGLPAFAKAKHYEQLADEANADAVHLLQQFATMEVGITFLDIAIVLVSISALVTTRVLTTVAVIGAAGGAVLCVVGLLR